MLYDKCLEALQLMRQKSLHNLAAIQKWTWRINVDIKLKYEFTSFLKN